MINRINPISLIAVTVIKNSQNLIDSDIYNKAREGTIIRKTTNVGTTAQVISKKNYEPIF